MNSTTIHNILVYGIVFGVTSLYSITTTERKKTSRHCEDYGTRESAIEELHEKNGLGFEKERKTRVPENA